MCDNIAYQLVVIRFFYVVTSIIFPQQVKHNSPISAVLTDDNTTMTSMEDDIENIGILDTDQGLEPFKEHFRYRMSRYVDQKMQFEKYEGGLEEFAKGVLPLSFCF